MRIAFAGTPSFAASSLAALHRAGHEMAVVLTQPDRPAGRGLQPAASAVKQLAVALNLPVEQPASLKTPEALDMLVRRTPDVMVVAAYGLILPREVLGVPRLGCINVHASLLPRWRGAAPIQRAILEGDLETGISIMQMNAGLDTGPVLLQEATPIGCDDTSQTVHDRLAALGAKLIVHALERTHTPRAQDDALATYAPKIDKREARIDWHLEADRIERQVRALNPAPGAATCHGEAVLKIWRAACAQRGAGSEEPGVVQRVNRDGLVVACGGGTALTLLELQRSGGKRLEAAPFLAGHRIEVGSRLGSADVLPARPARA